MYLTESTGWSGGAQQLLLMAQALRDRGHDLVLGCQPGSDIMDRARLSSLTVEPVRMRQDYDVPASFDVARIIRNRGIELLHAQHSTAHAIGLMAAFWTKIRAFAVTRRVIFPIKKNPFSRLKYLSGRINGYVAISKAVEDQLLIAGVDASRIEVIPSVMESQPVSREEGVALRRELGLSPDAAVIVVVGNYSDFKGQDYLIKAIPSVQKRFPNTQFLLVGRDVERLTPLAEQLGIASFVRLAGFRTDIPRVLAAADIVVMPSLQEAAGTALREAMAAGLPCVATEVGGIPESIVNEKTGLLVPPADSERLAAAIIRMLEDPATARRMAASGQAWVKEQFSLNAAAAKMEHFYQRLVTAS